MTKREVVRSVLEGRRPPYVPWQIGFTVPARRKLLDHYQVESLSGITDNHFVGVGSGNGYFEDLGHERYRDIFGVVWDRRVDKSIGVVEGCVLPEPSLHGYRFPDPCQSAFYDNIPRLIGENPDRFRVFSLGFSLFERAWTLRGMENFMIDFVANPEFVHRLLSEITEWNLAHVREALKYDIDAVHFGDDWGQQHGLLMGPRYWREFIRPQLIRMYDLVKSAGKFVTIHSCGDVDELFDDLIDIGLDCFNPFQPEVMDVHGLMRKYRGRLAFHGGASTQRTLPYGSVEEVRAEVAGLLAAGAEGGYIFAPAHAVPGDVPVENLVAMIDVVRAQ